MRPRTVRTYHKKAPGKTANRRAGYGNSRKCETLTVRRIAWGSPAAVDRPENLRAGANTSQDRSRDLGLAVAAAPVRNRDFSNLQLPLRSLDLHFDVQPEVPVAHLQTLQGLAINNAHGTQVGERNVPDPAN